MFAKRLKIFKKALKAWGIGPISMKACEECGELVQAISKVTLGKWPASNLAEEIADVEIMTEQLKQAYDLNAEVERFKAAKIDRLEAKLKNGKERF